MSFEIKVSNIGPLTIWNDSVYTLQDHADLIELVEEHPEFMGAMKAHLVQYTQETMADVVDALENSIYYNQQRAYSYLQAISAYGALAHQSLPEHRRQMQNLR